MGKFCGVFCHILYHISLCTFTDWATFIHHYFFFYRKVLIADKMVRNNCQLLFNVLSLMGFSRSYCVLALSYVFLTASNFLMVTTFSGHDNKLKGFWNIFSHIISHVWVLLFPIINLASSLVVLSLTRFFKTLIFSSVIVHIYFLIF